MFAALHNVVPGSAGTRPDAHISHAVSQIGSSIGGNRGQGEQIPNGGGRPPDARRRRAKGPGGRAWTPGPIHRMKVDMTIVTLAAPSGRNGLGQDPVLARTTTDAVRVFELRRGKAEEPFRGKARDCFDGC
jgi:hypothetical protein